MDMRAIIAALLLLSASPEAGETGWAALDGDTLIRHRDGMRVRLVGIDAPEIHARCPAEAILAERAKLRLATLLISGDVTFDWLGLDRYRRQLARVRVDGRNVAPLMIGEGLARAYDGRGRRGGWC